MEVKRLKYINKLELNQIMQIWLTSNLEAHDFIEPSYWSNAVDDVRTQIASANVYIVKKDNAIVGFTGLVGNYIAGIFVAHKYRCSGIGKAIVMALKEDHSELDLGVFVKNIAAIKFYQANNFTIIAKSFDAETGEQELHMKWSK